MLVVIVGRDDAIGYLIFPFVRRERLELQVLLAIAVLGH